MPASEWAIERFGVLADDLRQVVPLAVKRAHESAVAAQGASGTHHRDPYGHTLKNRQHECLAEALSGTEGVSVFRPPGASFELVRLTATSVTLLPWRYGTNRAASRSKVRMKPSGRRHDLLSGPRGNPSQYSIEQAELSEAELEAQFAEHNDAWDQLRSLARVVTIGYASSPHGIYDLGWADVELLDDNGTINWLHWEPLTIADASTAGDGAGDGLVDSGGQRHLQVAKTPDKSHPAAGPRFDGTGSDEDLPLRHRTVAGEPHHEAEPPSEETGTDDGPSDESR